jgi:hypothetical protein
MSLANTSIRLCLGALFVAASSCNRSPVVKLLAPTVPAPTPVALAAPARAPVQDSRPTALDMKIAQNAMSLSELALRLRGGDSQNLLISEIQKRHLVVATLSQRDEQEFASNGASAALIEAMKDEQNHLTNIQISCYAQLEADRKSRVARSIETFKQSIAATPERKSPGKIIGAKDSYKEAWNKEFGNGQKYNPLNGIAFDAYGHGYRVAPFVPHP